MDIKWHTKTSSELFQILNTNEHGLSKEEARRRLQKYGLNKLPETKAEKIITIFLRQFQSPLIYILLVAGLIVLIMKEIIDSFLIFAVLLFNAIVGAVQEGKAQNTLLALKKFVETKVIVLREGKELIISDTELVPGDILILQEGERVPADSRIISSYNIRVDEAVLTGESSPVHKITDILENPDLPTTEQKNMVFKGTHIVGGNGKAVVVVTGLETVIGKIAKEIAAIDTEIPLKTNIRHLSRFIIFIVLTISVSLFFIGIIFGKSAKEMFTIAVSLSVSIIPAGLPIVMTLVLATGVWRMSKRNVLVKRLQAVESLGQAHVIAVDKTGTITKNEMMVQKVYINSKFFEIGGVGYEPKGEIRLKEKIINPTSYPELILAGKIATLCANAQVMFSEENKQWHIAGDPTEAALLVFGQKIGFQKDDLEQKFPVIAEMPFDYRFKYHAKVYKFDNQKFLAIAGAPEVILNLSSKIQSNAKKHILLDNKEKHKLKSVFLEMSQEGLRIIALAEKGSVSEVLEPKKIHSLTFVGLLGIKDSLRPEVTKATERTTSAGIRVVMITGDHKNTAQAIAKEAGIYQEGDLVFTGQDIENLSELELSKKLPKISVFARTTPEHKLKIIKSYKIRREIVAMTGDGVNDAPSLVAADLGVAMGKIGTEVAKEASDVVLLDDNFGSIVSAVEEGRNIYKTIKKVILYLFSTSTGEVLTITSALFLGYPLPVLPGQILWINFVTDGFLDVALAMEPKEKGLLHEHFKQSKRSLVDKLMIQRIIFMASPMAIGTLFLFKKYLEDDFNKALTISFTSLVVFQWLNVWNCRHESKSIFQMNPFSNKFLIGAMFIVIPLQIFAIYNPIMQKVFRVVPLKLSEWFIILSITIFIILVEEIRKFFYRRKMSIKK